jgi:hypothetical protein
VNTQPKRRWYQFGLRSFLAFIFALAVASAWYGNRIRLLEQERARLAGKWYARVEAVPLVLAPLPSFDVDSQGVDLHVPYGGVGRIDFQLKNSAGVSRGIYRWDGDTITVTQSQPNQPRPKSFEEADGVSIWTGVRSGTS